MKLLVATLLSLLLLQALPAYGKHLSDVAATEGLTTFLDLLTKANLSELLTKEGPVTIFAPTNDAFSKMPPELLHSLESEPEKLKSLLLYHIVPHSLKSVDIINDVSVNTSEGVPVRTNVYLKSEFYPGFITVNGKRVSKTDLEADNGIVHVIVDVMYPLPKENIFAELELDHEGRFSTLISAIHKAELKDKLDSAGPFTFFAPTNEAFRKMNEETLKTLLEDREKITKVLLRHLVPGTLFQKGISWQVHGTVGGEQIQTQVFKGGVVKVVSLEGGARIKEADLIVRNGVVHAIDHVI